MEKGKNVFPATYLSPFIVSPRTQVCPLPRPAHDSVSEQAGVSVVTVNSVNWLIYCLSEDTGMLGN